MKPQFGQDTETRLEELPVEPSWLLKSLTWAGFIITTFVVAYVLSAATLLVVGSNSKYSLFALYWGLFARFLQWSVRLGIKTNLREMRDARMLGEQLFAAPIARRLVTVEIALSLALVLLGVG